MKSDWTVVIPVAGRGSRLGFNGPKVLYPVAGRPMAHWLLELFTPVASRIVWVTSPEHNAAICNSVEDAAPEFENVYVVQDKPLGMADAIEKARAVVSTRYCLVVWGDQVGLRFETIQTTQRALETSGAALALPTVLAPNPYIHFLRDSQGKLTGVQQAREGEIDLPRGDPGESDIGLFAFRSMDLFSVILDARLSQFGSGSETREFNLLPLLPLFETRAGGVVTVPGACTQETLGVNTPFDARLMEDWLSQRALQ